MHPDTRLGWVHLSVAALDRSLAFYKGVLGLQVLRTAPGFSAFGVRQSEQAPVPLVLLSETPHARPKPPSCRGLYHFALLLPTRRALAAAVSRLVRRGWAIDGAADHRVSEAVYLSDPDGHGIELYADRPREKWPWQGKSILMTTEPLDWDSLMAELPPEDRLLVADGMPAAARLGHVHLHVSRLERAEQFYEEVLGLDLVLRFGPGALFFSAGGYHHHVGANIWAGYDAPPPPADAVQLLHYSFVVPSADAFTAVAHLLQQAGVALSPLEHLGPEVLASAGMTGASTDGFVAHDPDGQALAIVVGAPAPSRGLERADC